MRKVFTLLFSLFLVHSAIAEEIHLNYDYFTQGPKYYKSGDWYVVLDNEEDWEVYLNWKAPKDDYCGTFTTRKFVDDYSYIFTPDNRENGGIHFDDITMTISIVEINPALEQIVIDATILGDDGNTYIVHATHDVVKAKDEVHVSIQDAVIEQSEYSYTITAQNTDWNIALTINSSTIIGAYTKMEQFDVANTHFIYQSTPIDPIQLEAQVAVGYSATGVLSYMAQCTMLSADTIIYHIDMVVPLPTPNDTIDVRCSNMRVDDTYAAVYQMMTISASNPQYEIQVMYNDTVLREHEYTESDAIVYITNIDTYNETESLVAHIQLQKDIASDNYQLNAEVRCTDNNVYRLHLSWNVPVPTDTVQIRFDQTAKASYYPQMNHDLLLINENGKYALDLNVVGVKVGEYFTLDNIGTYYTTLYDKTHYQNVEFAQVDGSIYQSGDTTCIVAEIIGFDATLYDVVLWYAVPTPTDTITLTFTDVPFENHLSEGYFQWQTTSEDQSTAISFMPATHQLVGTYTNDGLFGRFGDGEYDFFNDYTYVAEWNRMTNSYDTYTVEKGDLQVTMADDGTITAYASVVCENAKLYNITIHSRFEYPHLPYDVEEGSVECRYTEQDKITIEDYTRDGGYILFQAVDQDNDDMLVVYFFAESLDSAIDIPAGVYPINSSLANGTVLASTGVNEDNSVSPSLYATLSDGYLENMYFFVDGTVEVKNVDGTLRVEVNAVNSYNVPIHIVYDADATTNVENIVETTDTEKRIVNGQLQIIRNGKTFNAMGAKVK